MDGGSPKVSHIAANMGDQNQKNSQNIYMVISVCTNGCNESTADRIKIRRRCLEFTARCSPAAGRDRPLSGDRR